MTAPLDNATRRRLLDRVVAAGFGKLTGCGAEDESQDDGDEDRPAY